MAHAHIDRVYTHVRRRYADTRVSSSVRIKELSSLMNEFIPLEIRRRTTFETRLPSDKNRRIEILAVWNDFVLGGRIYGAPSERLKRVAMAGNK